MIIAGRHKINYSAKPLLVGILNLTPDSFSDGGDFILSTSAKEQIDKMVNEGADIIDVGGEASGPGSRFVSAQEEINRIIPALRHLDAKYPHIPVSVDTWKAEVASAALKAGASIINDIYGLMADPQLANVVAQTSAAVILMHNATMYRLEHEAAAAFENAFKLQPQQADRYKRLDLMPALMHQLSDSIDIAKKAGIAEQSIIIDPGLGFGLTTKESFAILNALPQLKRFELPILLGASRKRFIGDVVNLSPKERDLATAVITGIFASQGVDLIRIHNVNFNRQAIDISQAIKQAESKSPGLERTGDAECPKDQNRIVDVGQDLIILKGMVFRGFTGYLLEEKKLGQNFVIDVKLKLASNQASKTDKLLDSVNYAKIYDQIHAIMSNQQFDLIERLADHIAKELLQGFALIDSLEVRVSKPQAPINGFFEAMQVCVHRKRQD